MKIVKLDNKAYMRRWGRWFVGDVGSSALEKLKFGDVDDLFDKAMDSLSEGGKDEKVRKAKFEPIARIDFLDDSFLDQDFTEKPKRTYKKRK